MKLGMRFLGVQRVGTKAVNSKSARVVLLLPTHIKRIDPHLITPSSM